MADLRDSFPTAQPGPASQAGAAAPKSTSGNIKETVESILVAFILAFIFRAFIVEAFVIPTGSMAPTLMGAHMQFTCSHCGSSPGKAPASVRIKIAIAAIFGALAKNAVTGVGAPS